MSYLLDEDRVKQAVSIVSPAISAMMAAGQVKRSVLAVFIVDPASILCRSGVRPLYSTVIGDKENGERNYAELAERKARLAARTRMSTTEVRYHASHLYDGDDPPIEGGVYVDGLAIGCSGVEPWFDHMFAMWI